MLVEQTYRGEQSYIVKDPTTQKYFRFRPVEAMVMQSLDGERTAEEAAAALPEQGIKVERRRRSRRSPGSSRRMGLCERTLRERSVLLMERLRAERRARLRSRPLFQGNILRMRWSVGDPDELLNRTHARSSASSSPAAS